MITEDYVSFEIAKLLKERKFLAAICLSQRWKKYDTRYFQRSK